MKLGKSLNLRKCEVEQRFGYLSNILYLLKSKPMKFEELWESGFFRSKRELGVGIRRLYNANFIEKIDAVKLYVILGHGLSFLSLYPNWTPIPVEILDVIVPIGRKSDHEERRIQKS